MYIRTDVHNERRITTLNNQGLDARIDKQSYDQ